ncbi:hypothetical protein ACJ41O_007346 [Fusarium nematophilum]
MAFFALLLKLESIRLRIHEWRYRIPLKRPPFLLTTWGMGLQLFCQAVIIITICALWHKSNRDNGIATVGDSQNPYFDSTGFHPAPILSSSIVWATVPAWLMSAYSSLWSAMLDALKKVHPMLELEKANQTRLPGAETWEKLWWRLGQKLSLFGVSPGQPPSPPPSTRAICSTAKRTLLLDYGEWPILNGFKAIREGHVLLGICLLLRAALWTAGGLSAAIFAVAAVPSETQVALYSDKFFDEWLGWNYGKGTGNSSLAPAFDIVSATVLRDGENYPWTTDTHSFLPFFPASSSGPGNYTFDTEAYWATVECNVATEEDLVKVGGIQLALQSGDELNSAQVRIGFRFQGCDIRKWFTITNTTLQYARSWSTDCSQATGLARLGIFAGVYNATEKFHLSNLTVVSCKPLIYRSNVTLEVSISNDTTTAKVLRFSEKSRQQFWPFFVTTWLRNIPLYSVYEPLLYNDMDTFSRLIIGHASGKPTLDTITGKLQIVESFGVIFQAFFSNFVTLQAYFSAPRRDITGTLSRQKLRLFAVKSASFAVVGIISTAFITTLILALHLFRNRDILERYLDLMLGNALLFRDSINRGLESYLETLMTRALEKPQKIANIDLVKFAEQQPDLNNWLVWVEGTPRILHIKARSRSENN